MYIIIYIVHLQPVYVCIYSMYEPVLWFISSSLVCVCMNQFYGSSVHLQSVCVWTSPMVHQFISSTELSSVCGFTQVSLWRLSAMCVYWEIQKFWCIICLCSVIIEGVNAPYTFVFVSMFWLTATHTHMGFLINFNFNYLKNNVHYW